MLKHFITIISAITIIIGTVINNPIMVILGVGLILKDEINDLKKN